MGNVRIIDSINLFVETQNFINSNGAALVLQVTASATNTFTSFVVSNAGNRGAHLFVNVATVNATCTIALNLQALDTYSGNYATIARVSLDGIQATTATSTQYSWQIYPGITSSLGATGIGTNDYATNKALPRNVRIVASLTATASGGSAATSFTIDADKLL